MFKQFNYARASAPKFTFNLLYILKVLCLKLKKTHNKTTCSCHSACSAPIGPLHVYHDLAVIILTPAISQHLTTHTHRTPPEHCLAAIVFDSLQVVCLISFMCRRFLTKSLPEPPTVPQPSQRQDSPAA